MSTPDITAPASPNLQSILNMPRNPGRSSGARSLAPGQAAQRRLAAGSATQTITPEDTASSRSPSPDPLILRLRGDHDASGGPSTAPRRRITWAEDVVDNEGLGRKSSKVCCIYHKTREFGESSSEDDSSSDSSDSDSDAGGSSDSPDDGGARMSSNRRGRKHDHGHSHKHGDDCEHGGHGKSGGKGTKRKPSPNAYEKMPKYNTKPDSGKRRS